MDQARAHGQVVARPGARHGARRGAASRYAAGVAGLAAAVGVLAGCGGSSQSPSLSTTPVSGSTSLSQAPSSASPKVAAQAKAALALAHAAEARLNADYAWVAAAAGTKTSLAAKTVVLYPTQKAALAAAHGAMVNASHAARAAAQATPRDCGTVVAQRGAAYAAYNTGMAAYASFVPAANTAVAELAKSPADRAAVSAAFKQLQSLATAHPEAGIDLALESGLATAHGSADDALLLAAVHAAQTSLAATAADLQKVRANIAQIAPTCG
jgi:hypothetical protein